MKVGLWQPAEYAAEGLPTGWPAPGARWEPERGAESVRRAFELYDLAVENGFDMLSVAEHHGGYGSLVPSPTLMAAVLAQRYPDVTIGILGPILPLASPLRVAEEVAMVDVLSGGRTVVGFFRGVPTEYLLYGTPPTETGDMFREAFALVLRCWTEPEVFGWEGRHYRFRTVSTWPRPLQQPHPPIVSGVTNPAAAAWAGANGHRLGIFGAVVPPDRAAQCVDAYRAAGGGTGDDDILYRVRVYVADTDEEAEADAAEYELGNMRLLAAPEPERAAAAGKVLAALFGGGGAGHGGPPPRPEFCGAPETVIRQLRESRDAVGWGSLDVVATFPRLPYDKARRSLERFATEVLPALRGG